LKSKKLMSMNIKAGILSVLALAMAGCGGGGNGSSEATISPQGIFLVSTGTPAQLWAFSAQNSDSLQMSPSAGFQNSPDVTMAVNKIIYVSEDQGPDIFRYDDMETPPTNLTNNSGNDLNPRGAHTIAKIVFSSDRDGQNEIYSMDIDGGNLTRLTTNAANDRLPVFSMDDTKIAFLSDRSGHDEVYTMDPDGNNVEQLTNTGVDKIGLEYSADGQKIVYEELVGNSTLYKMNLDGSSPEAFATGTFTMIRMDLAGRFWFTEPVDGGCIFRCYTLDGKLYRVPGVFPASDTVYFIPIGG